MATVGKISFTVRSLLDLPEPESEGAKGQHSAESYGGSLYREWMETDRNHYLCEWGLGGWVGRPACRDLQRRNGGGGGGSAERCHHHFGDGKSERRENAGLEECRVVFRAHR